MFDVPYKENGRTLSGMDCYGLAMELCARAGNPLADVLTCVSPNVREIPQEMADAGCIIQCERGGVLHVAYMLDNRRAIHMTENGVQVIAIALLRNKRFFEVIK